LSLQDKPILYWQNNRIIQEYVPVKIALIKSFSEKPWRSPETYERIEKSLAKNWFVESIETADSAELCDFLASQSLRGKDELFVFNIAEYLDEKNKKGFLPSFLDEWGYKHLGSSAQVVEMGLDKDKTKRALRAAGIPTPRDFIAIHGDTEIVAKAHDIGYPLIVKPTLEGGHIGISTDSIVSDDSSLIRCVERIFEEHSQPAIVESYISGIGMREFSVGVLDTADRLFTPVEIDFESMNVEIPILSHETALKDLEKIKLVKDEPMLSKIIELAGKTFDAIGAEDYSRVDMRMNQHGCYVLEINVMPGLGPYSFLPEAALQIHGLDYASLIRTMVESAMRRNVPRTGSRALNG
jgi:D-alanine-D-alanine ligase